LTDGLVFTTRFAGGKGGRNALENRPAPPRHHPEKWQAQTPPDPGKVERFQQALKKLLECGQRAD
jgi:hypothetical protein